MENCNFSLVHIHLNNEGFAKRSIVKNDTVIGIYKNRYYHINSKTGVRYSYTPTNADLQANDWELIFALEKKIEIMSIKNCLKEMNMKFI